MRHALALALLLLAAPAGAATIVIDFEEETAWDVDSFVPVAFSGVELSSTRGLFVQDYFLGSRSLFVGEEGGTLMLTFLVPVVGLSLDFGGDGGEAEIRPSGASLTGFAGGIQVAFDSEAANQNLLVDQTLSIAFDSPIDSAVFDFVQIGEFEPASSVVDNITITTLPEPGTLGLGAAAALLVWLLRR